ncbi:MAG: C25 family cysteine peptidase [Candidatus Stygibacter australis]|nr:C25 family cysteine peptidase [Candidatus Stygibacter australis]
MKRIMFLLLSAILISSINATWEVIDQSINVDLIEYDQISESEINLSFHLDGYEVQHFSASGEERLEFNHPQARGLDEKDRLELPIFNWVIELPATGDIKLEILSSEQMMLDDVLLSRDQSFQNSGEIAHLGEPAIMRGVRMVPVTFSPLIYNATRHEMTIYSKIEVKITTSGENGKNCISHNSKLSRSFEPIFDANVLNYQEMRGREDYQQPSMIIVCPDNEDVVDTLSYLVDWKLQKGFQVTLVTTAETGETAEEIKDYIQNAYDNWENPPEYICLAGDTNGSYAVPTWFHNSQINEAGDHPYGQLDGDDILLDAHVGRLSYNSISQLQVLVSKILYYEKSPMMDYTEWYQKSLLVGDPSNSGPSTISTMQAIKEMMLTYPDNWNSHEDFYEIYGGSFANQMNAYINTGCLYMFYRGASGCSGWYPGATNNSFMLPFVSLMTSGTGPITETLTLMGTASNPTGAIGAVGQTNNDTDTCFNNALSLGMASGFLQHDIYSMGAILSMGKFCIWNLYPQNPANSVALHSHYTSLVGDPSLELWTGVPQTLTVMHPESIAEGEDLIQITVLDHTGAYAEGACVTLSALDPSDYAITRFCDSNGEVLMPIPGIFDDENILTVTKHGHLPYIDTLTVCQAEQYVNVRNIEYLEIAGNGDGLLNPGESFELDVSLFNYGTLPVEGITAWLSTENEYVTVTSSEVEVGDIGAWEIIDPAVNFQIEISESALGGIEPLLEFRMADAEGQEWTSWETAEITGANLWLSAIQVGNDNFLHPGQIDAVFIELTNNGALPVEDISVSLSCAGSYITLIDSLSYFTSIPAGGSVYNFNDGFSVETPEEMFPGSLMNLRLEITNDSGYEAIIPYSVPVGGTEVTDPYGPDEYGYWCFDDGDLDFEYCPEFNWVEIDPDYGGAGEELSIYSSGNAASVQVLDLPGDFNFNFYGENYAQITVSTSGWIAPGVHQVASFMNWYIPSPQGPSPMIAVFWDDLSTAGNNICWQYFADEHYLVIEWSRVENGDTESEETFEVILYDADFYPTLTSASQIKMQYLVVNNDNAGSYRADHGQYCTVGLENYDSTIGLQYTFNNSYAVANKVLEDNTALLFTPANSGEAAWLNIADITILNGNDEYIEAGDTVIFNLNLHNSGNMAADDISIVISTESPYISIQQNTGNLAELLPGESAYLDNELSFIVSEDVSDFYEFTIDAAIECESGYWDKEITLTAYEHNTFSLDQEEISLELEIDQTDSRTLELTNIGDDTVNYYLRIEEILPEERDISGSTVTCDSSYFVPGETTEWILEIYNNSPDTEWITDLSLEFPLNVILNYATDVIGGSGGNLEWDGNTGVGIVNWHGTTANGWGVIHSGEYAYVTLNVSLGPDFAGNLHLPWVLTGDGYGVNPHAVDGEIILFSLIQWINLEPSSGTLEPDESCDITMNFDAADLEFGWHNALLEITTDSWDIKRVNISLNVLSNEGDEPFIPEASQLLGNYPNPFNPSTKISFLTAESGQTELTIYNIKGQIVRKLVNEPLDEGKHEIYWDGRNEQGVALSSGIFLYRLKTASEIHNSKMILLK